MCYTSALTLETAYKCPQQVWGWKDSRTELETLEPLCSSGGRVLTGSSESECLSALAIPVERRISAQDKLYQSNTQLLISRSLRQCLIQVVLSSMALPLYQARLSVQKWPCFKLVKSEQLGFLWYLSLSISLFISPLWRVWEEKKQKPKTNTRNLNSFLLLFGVIEFSWC